MMIKSSHFPNLLLPGILAVFIAVIMAKSIVTGNEKAGMVLSLLPLIAWLGVKDKRYALYLFLMMMPFFSIPAFSSNLMGITGAKPFNLLAAFTLVIFFFHGGNLLKNDDLIEKRSMAFLMMYFAVFTLATFRSLEYLKILGMLDPENFHDTPLRYLLSNYIRPCLYMIPFIYILKHIKTEQNIQKCIDVICFSILILSSAVVVVGFFNIDAVTSGRNATNEIISSNFGMHYNSVGSIYIIVTPLLVWQLVTGKKLALATFIFSILAVSLLQSRSTIVVFLGGTMLVLFLLKKRKLLIFFAGLSALIFIYWLPSFLANALTTNIESGDINKIFTGRIDSIWIPLMMERWHNPGQLFFGVGRYSMTVSPLYLQGHIMQVNTAHNAFIEFFIDNGLIIFSIFIFCLVYLLKKAWSWAKKLGSPLAWVLYACLVTYLVGTISGRKIYPDHHNMHLFPIIALFINLIRVKIKEHPFR